MLKSPHHNDEHARVDHNLTNQSPSSEQIALIEEVRAALKQAGHVIVTACPPSRELALALTALEETTMWAVAAIARAHTIEAG